ncbi:MAG: class I adenylate-forming enzyme family protein [Nitrospinota bacterium]
MSRKAERLDQVVRLSGGHDAPPDHEAVVFHGGRAGPGDAGRAAAERLTYAELEEAVRRTAGDLLAGGLQPGQRVALFLRNSVDFLRYYFAVPAAGGVLVPINTWLTPPELRFILADSAPSVLVADAPSAEICDEASRGLDGIGRKIAVCGRPEREGWESGDERPGPSDAPPASRGPEELALLHYTSGTTGRPKGAMLSHANLLDNGRAVLERVPLGRDDRILLHLPLFHNLPMAVFMIPGLMAGATLILQDGFEAARVMEALESEAVSVLPGVPTTLRRVLDALPEGWNPPPSLRLLASGGAGMDPDLIRRLVAAFPGAGFVHMYGASETSQIAHLPAEEALAKAGSVGRPIAGVEIRLVKEDGEEARRGEVGEVQVRGPGVMRGYWNLPRETREALTGGLFRTGDLGRVDEDGCVYLVDRLKDVIIRGGENVYPREVEEALTAHPAVAEACVVGRPDPELGEVPRALIVRSGDSKVTADELRAHCSGRLAPFKVPSEFVFVDSLPKTVTGKLRRSDLR